ncbi:hypothetical protein FOCC_FOCC012850, partial [Frankliniella occidentalis]
EYLLVKNYPLSVWISEDATRITGRIQYDPKTTSADTITAYFEKATRAANIYTIMAQPVHDKSAAFCLCIFGTDNKFTHEQVVKRWRWMLKEAAKEGISIMGFSSDGDPKLLKAMRFFTFSGEDDIPLKWAKFFSANWDLDSEPYCMQDAVHIGTKLRSLLLKRKRLPMGPKYAVSITHLEMLKAKEEKELHGLCATDITTADKMNFQAVLNLSHPRVTTLLFHSKKVPNAVATAVFLEIVECIIKAFVVPSLTVCDRLRMLWKSVFFLRLWKSGLCPMDLI